MTKGTAYNGVVDWLQFRAPDRDGDEIIWTVNLTFLMSGWQCIYGQGCPGHFGVTDRYITPDLGCCTDGFYIRDDDDQANIEKRIAQLTPDDWDDKNRRYVEKNGWNYSRSKEETKSRVMDGGCVFANREGGSAGKPGCAFVAMANRLGENVDDSTVDGHDSHSHVMPAVCHELPLKFSWEEKDEDEPDDRAECTIDAWDASRWTEDDPYREQDGWMAWWCVDSPEAYINAVPLYVRMKDTLIGNMGNEAYDEMVRLILRKQPKVDPMGGAVVNGGRPLLPLIIGGRTPKRPDVNFEKNLMEMESRE